MRRNIFNKDTTGIIIIISSILLLFLNILHIIYVPVTHDEGITFMRYISLPYSEIISYKNPTANNHILNTLLTKWLMSAFHNRGVFVLRMANLVAQIAYMIFCWLIVKKIFKDNLWQLGAFIILNCNPFLFEFWGLCRGYSLAIAAMMGSIFFLLRYLQTKSVRSVWQSLFLAVLSVYSNFSLLYFFMAITAIFFTDGLLQRSKFKSICLVLLAYSVLLAALIARPLALLRSHNELYYGGDKGIIADTIRTLLVDCWHLTNAQSGVVVIAAYVVALSGLLPGIYWIRQVAKKKHWKNDIETVNGFALWLLLILPCTFIVLQHLLLGTKVLISRTALFLVPLYLLALLYLLSRMQKPLMAYLPAILCVPVLFNFFAAYSISKSWTWSLDDNNVVVLNHIVAANRQRKSKIKLRVDWQFAPGLQYYTTVYYAGKFEPVVYTHDDIKPDNSYDYYYIFQGDASILQQQYTPDTLMRDGTVVLLKKK